MIQLGKFNTLKVEREKEYGFFLEDSEGDAVLLPKSLLEGENVKIGDETEVFVYLDSEGRTVATKKRPLIQVGEVAYLEVIGISSFGAFCDMGLDRDLFIPMREQRFKLLKGKKYLFLAYIDKTGRLAGTTNVDDYLDMAEEGTYEVDQIVSGVTYARSAGETLKLAIDGKYRGIMLGNEHDNVIYPGEVVEGRIKRIYEDGVIGLTNRKKRLDAREEIKEDIISYLKCNGGEMPYNDKTSPEEIREVFKTSKNYFKMALGGLMKEGLIEQNAFGTKLIEK